MVVVVVLVWMRKRGAREVEGSSWRGSRVTGGIMRDARGEEAIL